jgi:hypothetical protein
VAIETDGSQGQRQKHTLANVSKLKKVWQGGTKTVGFDDQK